MRKPPSPSRFTTPCWARRRGLPWARSSSCSAGDWNSASLSARRTFRCMCGFCPPWACSPRRCSAASAGAASAWRRHSAPRAAKARASLYATPPSSSRGRGARTCSAPAWAERAPASRSALPWASLSARACPCRGRTRSCSSPAWRRAFPPCSAPPSAPCFSLWK